MYFACYECFFCVKLIVSNALKIQLINSEIIMQNHSAKLPKKQQSSLYGYITQYKKKSKTKQRLKKKTKTNNNKKTPNKRTCFVKLGLVILGGFQYFEAFVFSGKEDWQHLHFQWKGNLLKDFLWKKQSHLFLIWHKVFSWVAMLQSPPALWAAHCPSLHTRKILKIFPVQVPEQLIPSHFKWCRQLGKSFSHQADGLERHFTETIQNTPTRENFPFVSAFFLLQEGSHINTLKPLGSPLFCNNYRTISSNSIAPIATNVSLHQLQTEAVQFASGSQGFRVSSSPFA